MKNNSIFCVFNKKKDNNKTAHWVGHQKLGSLDIYELFKRKQKMYEKEASITGKKEEQKNKAKKSTYDDDTNAEDNKIINKDKEKGVTI